MYDFKLTNASDIFGYELEIGLGLKEKEKRKRKKVKQFFQVRQGCLRFNNGS